MTAGRRRVAITGPELSAFSRLLEREVHERFGAPFTKFSSGPVWTYGEAYRLVPCAEGGARNTERCRTTGRDRNAG